MEIYLDVLFIENVVINYLILLITSKFSKTKVSSLRLFLGALIGAIYVIILIVSADIKFYYTLSAKIILSLIIIGATFAPKSFKSFLKILVIFYMSTFVFAGSAFACMYFNNDGGFVRDGIVYVFSDSKWTQVVLSIFLVLIVLKVFWDFFQNKIVKYGSTVPLKITFEKKSVDISALVDTGNLLVDPLTNSPVVVVEFMALKDILPFNIKNIFEESNENDLHKLTSELSDTEWASRLRIIPFSSIGKENGILIGFKSDYIKIGEGEGIREEKNVIIGIYNKSLSKNGRYAALLGSELALTVR